MAHQPIPFSQAIRPHRGMPFLKWLMRLQDRPWLQLLNLPLFFLLFLPLVGGLAAVNLMLGMALHELGHLLVFRLSGIRARLLGLWPLGAVAVPANEQEDGRSDQLPWWNIGWLLLIGPSINIALMGAGLVLLNLGSGQAALFGEKMVEMNGMLAILNLIPVWNLDAGQFFQVIYSSLKEEHDTLLAILVTGMSIGVLVLVGATPMAQSWWVVAGRLLLKGWWVIFVIVLAVGAWHKQGKDNPLHSKSVRAMSAWQIVAQLAAYFGLTIGALAIVNGAPTLY